MSATKGNDRPRVIDYVAKFHADPHACEVGDIWLDVRNDYPECTLKQMAPRGEKWPPDWVPDEDMRKVMPRPLMMFRLIRNDEIRFTLTVTNKKLFLWMRIN